MKKIEVNVILKFNIKMFKKKRIYSTVETSEYILFKSVLIKTLKTLFIFYSKQVLVRLKGKYEMRNSMATTNVFASKANFIFSSFS